MRKRRSTVEVECEVDEQPVYNGRELPLSGVLMGVVAAPTITVSAGKEPIAAP